MFETKNRKNKACENFRKLYFSAEYQLTIQVLKYLIVNINQAFRLAQEALIQIQTLIMEIFFRME